MKRFYKTVTTRANAKNDYAILLDGRPVKTPSGRPLSLINENLANLVMMEWAAQKEEIDPNTMPLTQLTTTKLDQISDQRDDMTTALMKYLNTDLICYRTDYPPQVGEAQCESWDKWIDWFENEFGYRLETTTALSALTQNKDSHTKIMHYVKSLDADHFTIFQLLVSVSGSLVLALAFMKGALDDAELYKAIRVEELYKAKIYDEEKYGQDPVQEQRENAIRRDLKAARAYLDNL